ncbi:MAG: hypothetical protein ACTSXX_10365 [Candidatus Baldrarchaeia archaeon]
MLTLFSSLRDILDNYETLGSLVKELYEQAINEGLKEPLEHVIKNLARHLRKKFQDTYKKASIIVPAPPRTPHLRDQTSSITYNYIFVNCMA